MTKRRARPYWPLLTASGLFLVAIGVVVGDWLSRTANTVLLVVCILILFLASWYSMRLSRRRG